MSLYRWTPGMSVGIAALDKEHQGLFDIMNKLHEGMLAGKGNETVRAVLADLVKYTKVHFSNEEVLLRKHTYPRLAEHLAAHDTFRARIVEIEHGLNSGSLALSIGTTAFLRDWLTGHIVGLDMLYKDYLTKKGVA